MPSRRTRLGDIPGIDFRGVGEGWEMPEAPLFVIAEIMPAIALGAITVTDSRGQIERAVWDQEEGGSLLVTTGADSLTSRVVLEPPDYYARSKDPSNRGDATYAGFRLRDARAYPLSNGGRLLASKIAIMGREQVTFMPSVAADIDNRRPAYIRRVAANVDEAVLVLEGIGAYAGLEPADASLLADVSLNFPTGGGI